MNKVVGTVAKGLFKAATKSATKFLTQEAEQYDQEPQQDHEPQENQEPQEDQYAPTTMKPQQRYTTNTYLRPPSIATTMLTFAALTSGLQTTAHMQDVCKSYGIIREEQTFQLVGTTKDVVDIAEHAKIMRDVSQGAKDLEIHLRKAMERGPNNRVVKQIPEYKNVGKNFPPQHSWQYIGIPRLMRGTPAKAVEDCLGKGRLPPTSKADMNKLAAILESQEQKHTYLTVDTAPGAIVSQMTGEDMMLVPAAKQDTFEASRLVSFHKRPAGSWTISPVEANTEKNYVCLLTSGALQTPGLAIKTKGATQTLISNIGNYQRHYSKFFELINSATGSTSFGGRTAAPNATRAVKAGSPMLLQILGHIKSLDSKTTWDTLLKQDYVCLLYTSDAADE